MDGASLWGSISQHFPLLNSSQKILDDACRSLWGWADCSLCLDQGNCMQTNCPRNLRVWLEPYLKFYLETTSLYTSEDWDEPILALKSHADLQRLIELIQNHPDTRKSELISRYFASHSDSKKLNDASKNYAFDLALSTLTMVPFSKKNQFYNQYPILAPETWQHDWPAHLVMCNAIKAKRSLSKIEACSVTHELSAARLEEFGVAIQGTSDLRQHLAFNSKKKALTCLSTDGFPEGVSKSA